MQRWIIEREENDEAKAQRKADKETKKEAVAGEQCAMARPSAAKESVLDAKAKVRKSTSEAKKKVTVATSVVTPVKAPVKRQAEDMSKSETKDTKKRSQPLKSFFKEPELVPIKVNHEGTRSNYRCRTLTTPSMSVSFSYGGLGQQT